jgi:hypothetical protein
MPRRAAARCAAQQQAAKFFVCRFSKLIRHLLLRTMKLRALVAFRARVASIRATLRHARSATATILIEPFDPPKNNKKMIVYR